MLEPDVRELLLDALRPPDDCELVHAVGTTYSLDLQALLFAPLAFAMFDWALDDTGAPNPIALLESLRRYADRTTVFCQAGQIGLPRDYQPLLTYLEPCVVPVTPTASHRIFHPKLWVLRFRPHDGSGDRYRLLCLTRNLTFDTAWDTACVLDGIRRAGSDTVGRNRPLVDFLRALGTQTTALGDGRRSALRDLAEDIADVRFAPPDGFDGVEFHPLGLADGWPLRRDARRVLVVAPFLTAGALADLHGSDGTDVLISRQEMLDALGGKALEGFETYAFSESASRLDELDDESGDRDAALPLTDEMRGDAIGADLRGLHAKLIVAEYDREVRFYTGSANATDAAFGGNIEFLVELFTRQDGVGIGSLLAESDGVTTLRDLIEPYRPRHDEPLDESDHQTVSRVLDEARRALGSLHFTATLSEQDADTYLLDLRADGRIRLPDQITAVSCWPISHGQGHQVTPKLDTDGLSVAFGAVSRDGITSFFALELRAQHGAASDDVRFVVNAELVGAPEGRADDVITQILRDRQDVLRYLLFLLADASGGQAALFEALGAAGDGSGGEWGLGADDTPLFETLMRTLSRDPARLDHVAKLLDDLRDSDRAAELVPTELNALWTPIWNIRQELDT
jgi:hypothetical protein